MLVIVLAGFASIVDCTPTTLIRQISPSLFDSTVETISNATQPPVETGRLQERQRLPRSNLWQWTTAPLASDELWCAAQAKGAQMYNTFWKSDAAAGRAYNPPRVSANSAYRANNINNMMYSTWGWTDADRTADDAHFGSEYGRGWDEAMQARGIGTVPWQGKYTIYSTVLWFSDHTLTHLAHTDIYGYSFSHGSGSARDEHGQPILLTQQAYTAYGHQYRVTGGRIKFGVQDKAGAIMVSLAVSPSYAFNRLYGRAAQPEELPVLQAASDLLWAGWIRGTNPTVGNPNVANLNYMFMNWIINRDTLSIMKRALHSRGKDYYSKWPGDDFSTATPEGQALLGSPNGKPMGYLVNQRKLDMGVK